MAMMAIAGTEAVMATRALELGPIGQHVAESIGRIRRDRGLEQNDLAEKVQEDIDALGDLVGLEPSLAELAHTLAREVDRGGSEFGPPLTALTKELRTTLKELWAQRPAKD